MNSFKSRISRSARLPITAALLFGGGALAAPRVSTVVAAPLPAVQVIASHLNNPRSLAWDSKMRLLVSEAGTGGPACVGTGADKACLGLTGAVARIRAGKLKTIARGLFSVSRGREGVTGPDGLAFSRHHLYTVITDSSAVVPPGLPPKLAAAAYNQAGRVLELTGDSRHSIVADPGDYDYAWSNLHKSLAAGNFPDANPYALLFTSKGRYVVDAGTNTLDIVKRNGSVRVLAFVPNAPVGDSVPTCVAQGKDGALYIGQLTAAGNKAGAANVYRFDRATKRLTVWQTGFSAITGCGFGANGDFYVTEFDTTGFPPTGAPAGAVIQIAPDGTRTVLGQGQLFAPNGFLAGPDGSIYVTNWSVMPGTSTNGSPTGEVVKITK